MVYPWGNSLPHMLVSLGSATFPIIGMNVLFATAEGDPSARIDPTRVVQGVVGGIGFLGAGSIIRSGGQIQGITTGASIWLAGAIGAAAGINNFYLAGMVTCLALVIMVALGRFEHELVSTDKDQ
ncbi:MAG: MgtC/SapB family protein [Marinobacter sp.]